ncbi:proline-rich protein 2-like [Canis lupus dingo]|uniref:proline-rich protein 2-like n=1 Tax=Canis lupus dingo TaxID=286419 RepID=UPI0020C58C16|nr:proline-rich protein 2-like [Canis lupus dingo]
MSLKQRKKSSDRRAAVSSGSLPARASAVPESADPPGEARRTEDSDEPHGARWGQARPEGGAGPAPPPPPGPPCATPDPARFRLTGRGARLHPRALTSPTAASGSRRPRVAPPRRSTTRRRLRNLSPPGGPGPGHWRPRRRRAGKPMQPSGHERMKLELGLRPERW